MKSAVAERRCVFLLKTNPHLSKDDTMLFSISRLVTQRALLLAMLAAPAAAFAQEPQESAPAAAIAGPSDTTPETSPRVFELRVYTAAPGKMESLNRRFRDHTLKFFEKHGITSIGYWTSEAEPNRLYYLVAYPDRASREQRLVKGVAKDRDFLQVVADSEKDGKLTVEIESVILNPTDYSPMK
ncbi:hypothetical protein K2D_09800 [Planctomycetes bacterium K2D]|uniref:NIPSNAP domain-containing protein n=2 Tax=Botrimarina mediterranea TaxID=2528022 RepID=A0A518K4W3_9BACT|nr:hypothetical protein Spa11_09970 [Botrimarina mediterranea]QDV77389.1 hypothetical protein K2D_09800 [Planctomycetes bacterium K2D]